ncbi:bacterio-opsin activator [halophilic archaeon]|nr:bacterio-opsin activator [halophilic archaeon]
MPMESLDPVRLVGRSFSTNFHYIPHEHSHMSIIAEISIPATEFRFGEALTRGPPAHIELERLIPSEEMAIPYIWVECEDIEDFERSLREFRQVTNLKRLDRLDHNHGRTLYRIEWDEKQDLLVGILTVHGAILEAHGGNEWKFQLRFDDHDRLAEFYNFCMDTNITLRLDRVFSLSEAYRHGRMFELTPRQREALVLAAKLGYFETPSRATLNEIGEELGISSQAASKRIRGGVEKLVTNGLLTTV